MAKLLVGTRKGAWVLDASSGHFSEPILFGNIVNHVVADPRDPSHWVMAVKAGHLGPTVYVSLDGGQSWSESAQPPAFPKKEEGGKSVDHVFYVAPGHASEPGVWYAGTSPQGLFRSEDGGATWSQVAGFNEHPMFPRWTAGDAPPDGARLHSIQIDPRDARHLYVGLSSGGVFESTDRGNDWQPLNRGCYAEFLPGESNDYGHDPHCVRVHPAQPDRLYQQNHCGIYRMDRPSNEWVRIGDNMPREIGDIGFPIVVHPTDPDTAWVFPMDGTSVWPRTSPGGKPAVYRTRDAGATWQRQDRGLPVSNAWFTVYRQAMTLGATESLYFGTTSGEVWASEDGGENWRQLAAHLPRIQSLEWML